MNSRKDDFIMLPKVGFVFKELMTNEKISHGFLSAMLDIDVNDIKKTIVKNTDSIGQKGIVDVHIDNGNMSFNIELELDEKCTDIRKYVSIQIVYFNYHKQLDRYHTVYYFMSDNEPRIILSEKMEWHMIELPKLPPTHDGTSVYDWAKFFTAERREDFETLAEKNEYLQEAYEQLDRMSQDEQKRMEYHSYMKMKDEGRQETLETVIGNMSKHEMTAEQIAEYTGISLPEVQHIIAYIANQ